MNMKRDTTDILNDLLQDWHRRDESYSPVEGNRTSAGFAGVQSLHRQWASEDDVLDIEVESGLLKAVGEHIMALSPEHRTVLQLEARNLATGHWVWRSARLPNDPKKLEQLRAEARKALLDRLIRSKLL